VQEEKKRLVVVLGRGRTVGRTCRLYERIGTFAAASRAPGEALPAESIDLVHVVDTGDAPLHSLAEWLAPTSAPVVLPFSPSFPVADFESTVVALESRGLRLMLGYPPMYAPPFAKLLHAVATGIVGRVAQIELLLPGGWPEFRTQVEAGSSLAPACVGLAYVVQLTGHQPTWQAVAPDALRVGSQLGEAVTFTVAPGPQGAPPTLVVRGDASELRLTATGSSQVLAARRGGVERELARNEDMDVLCATAKAAGLLADNRTRSIIPGHSGLLLLQAFAGARRALDPPATPDQEPVRTATPTAPPKYDLYQKIPLRWGGKGRESPLWEAKFNIESVCNQDCLFCFARDGDLRLTELEGTPELFGRLTHEGIEGVMFSGREPTLNAQLPEYIARAKAAGMKNVTVETNALLFADADMVSSCRRAGLDAAFVSFHSIRPETVARLTRTEDSFPRTLQGIRNLLAQGIEVELNCVVNRHNYQELEEIASFVGTDLVGITSMTFSFIAPLGQAEENRHLVPPISEAAPHLRAALLACAEAGVVALVPGRCGIPLCFLPGLERFFVDYQLRHEAPETGLASDRVKNAECDHCRFTAFCQGLWATYARLYGTDEIRDGYFAVNTPSLEPTDG
jgi:pyruvate-formate lyase-activating enzyme